MKLSSTKFIFTLFIAFFTLFGQTAWADIIYVNGNFSSTPSGILGESWGNPYIDLQDALAVAVAGDQIWVAGSDGEPYHEYTPETTNDSFVLKDSVKLYGGFPGNLTGTGFFTDRDVDKYETILTGEFEVGHAYHVLKADNTVTDALIDGFIIYGGEADGTTPENSGAGFYNDGGSVTFNDCIFDNNQADDGGGAIYSGGQLTLTNCEFTNNTSTNAGGAIFFASSAENTLILNCKFDGNSSDSGGAIFYYNNTSHEIINSLLTNNVATSAQGGGGVYINANGGLNLINCTLADNNTTSPSGGAGLHIANTGIATIQNAIFYGNTSPNNSTEIDQISTSGTVTLNIDNTILEDFGSSYQNGVVGDDNFNANPNFTNAGGGDYSLLYHSPAINAGNASFLPQDDLDIDGDANTIEKIPLDLAGNQRVQKLVLDIGAFEFSPKIWYVDNSFLGVHSGETWNEPINLQDALSAATAGDQIWVAVGEGTYTPHASDRTISFYLTDGIEIYGGFPSGLTANDDGDFSLRDADTNTTTLSGDLGGGNNSYHILFADGVQDVIIDGFTIQNGLADGIGLNQNVGAAFYSNEAEVTFNDCTFQSNAANAAGGAIYTTETNGTNGKLILKKCIFTSNNVTGIGSGGAIYTEGLTQSAIISCQFFDNNASGGTGSNGGGIFYQDGNNHQIVNGLFYGNSTSENGGAIYVNSGVNLDIINTTITENISVNNGGVYLSDGTLTIKNSILWNNDGSTETNQIQTNGTVTLTIDNTIIQGGSSASFASGAGNLTADPLFVGGSDFSLQSGSPAIDAGNISHLPTDDFDIDEDGNIAENLPDDLAGNERLENSTPDMGAYEAPPHMPIIIYVKKAASGADDGTTWDDAFIDLQSALAIALDGDQIWVAEGEYLPDGGTADKTFSFEIPEGVELYGGFADADAISAHDGDFSFRDAIPSDSPTILSGDINGNDTNNTHHIVTIQFSDIILDGFIIEKGNATGVSPENGGAMLIQGSSLEVFNCIFRDNYALDAGGAISLSPGSNLDLTDCHFENNSAGSIGGAIYNDQNLRVYTSTFENNFVTSSNGGAIYNAASLEIYDGEFENNTAINNGGAIYNTNNLTINNSTFDTNSTTAVSSKGGAIYNTNSLEIHGTIFENNILTAGSTEGGAIYTNNGGTIDDCLFQNNRTVFTGGAIRSAGNLTLTNSTFIENNSDCGNGLYIRGSGTNTGVIDRCTLRRNLGGRGVIYIDGQIIANISNSLFDGNAGSTGAAISAWASSTANITNCTLVNQIGGVVVNATQSSNIDIMNTIFWDNANTSVSENTAGNLTIDYSLVPETTVANLGISYVPTNMIYNIDPSFRNPNIGDYRLKPNSVSIDVGDGTISPINLLGAIDLDGNPRIIDFSGGTLTTVVDLGAYESPDFTNFPLAGGIIYVNTSVASSGDGISWDSPFKTLQEALAVAYAGHQIWVAEGTYYPTDGTAREISFDLIGGVRMYGGFPDYLSSDDGIFFPRNTATFQTILSGDIGTTFDDSDNSFHVLIADGLDATSLLDGFIIEGGNADGTSPDDIGGGILITNSNDFTIQNCIFSSHFANEGGAVYADASVVNFTNVLAYHNLAQANGGAFFLNGSNPKVINCTIVNNDVDNSGTNGAGIYSQNSNPEIYNTIIFDNKSGGSENLLFQFNDTDNNFIISNSIVEDWGASTNGSYNTPSILNTEPDLDNFKIQNASSPAVDAGDNSFLPADNFDTDGDGDFGEDFPIDLANATRVQNSITDIGAYESPFAIDLYKVTNTNSSSSVVNSLPWVINNVNNISSGVETVIFDIPITDTGYDSGSGKWTISLINKLTITQKAIFDATTQAGWTDIPVIQLDGGSTVTRLFDFQGGGSPNPDGSEVYGFEFSNSTAEALALENVSICKIGVVGKMNVFNDDNNDDVGLLLLGANDNEIVGNRFGTDVTGTIAQGNSVGIFLEGNCNYNLISQNTIAHTTQGMQLRTLANTQGNRITQNSFYDNSSIGIDLNDNNSQDINDPNDTDGGANDTQNFPVLSNATANGNELTFTYDLTSFGAGSYDIEFFLSDGNGKGNGEIFLTTIVAPNNGSFTTTITNGSAFLVGQYLVATARNLDGSTSEFSNEIPIDIELPLLGLAKEVSVSLDNPSVPNVFNVTYTIFVKSYGNVDLQNIALQDDLDAAFTNTNDATFTTPTGLTSSNSSLLLNSAFDGSADKELLSSGSLLAGESGTIQFTVQVTTTNPSNVEFFNSVTGTAENGIGIITLATSNEGTDPDAFNPNGIPNETPNEEVATRTLLENPVIGISKEVVSQTNTGNGLFDVTYRVHVENLGNVDLYNVQVTDDLNNTFGTTLVSVSTPVLGTGLVANTSAYDGNGNNEFLDAASSTLAAGTSETITFTVSLDLTGSTQSSFNNAAIGSAESSNGIAIGAADLITVTLENPVIGISKEVVNVIDLGNGQFDVQYRIHVENYGNVDLSNVQVTDDLVSTFAGATSFMLSGTVATSNSNLIPNSSYNGIGDTNLLNISTLAINAKDTINFTVHLNLNGSTTSSFDNFASATANSANLTPTSDISTDGINPDFGGVNPSNDGDGNPSNNAVLTPVILENPVIGVSKEVTSQTNTGNGLFDVTYRVHLENLGNVDLYNAQVTDDLNATFGSTLVSVSSITATGGLLANSSFNGNLDTELLAASSNFLAVGTTASIEFTVQVNVNGSSQSTFDNFVTGTAESATGATTNDISTNGDNPDPDGDFNPNENDVTPVTLENPILGLAKEAGVPISTGFGTFDVPYTITLENFGNVPISDIRVTDDLNTTFADATSFILSGTVTTTGALSANAAFNGNGDINLLSSGTLATGTTETITFTVHVDVNGSTTSTFDNFAIGTGTSPNGTGTNDISTDGANPDVGGTNTGNDGDGNPSNNDVLTPIILENPVLELLKSVGTPVSTGFGTFNVPYTITLQNSGNVTFSNFQVTDNLFDAFGTTLVSVSTPVLGTGLMPSTLTYDGNVNIDFLDASSSTLATGTSETITFTVSVDVNGSAMSSFTNTANGNGTSPSGFFITDTHFVEVDLENPILGLAKEAGTPISTGFGTFDVPYAITVENMGNVPISDIRITDDLNATFGIGLATFAMNTSSLTVGSSFTPNATFNGNTDIQLLSSATLAVNGFETILFTVHVDLHGDNSILEFNNFAIGTGTSPNGIGTSDISTNGNNPDVGGTNTGNDGDGNPSNNDVLTPVILENPVIGISKEVVSQASAGNGLFDVTYRVYVENLGNVDLYDAQVTDDLNATFGSTLVSVSSITATGGLLANSSFNGNLDTELLAASSNLLAVGATEIIEFTVRVDVNGSTQSVFNNSASTEAESATGATTNDISTDGDNPDPSGDFNPNEQVLTPVTLENPILGLAKEVGTPVSTGFGTFDVPYAITVENMGNVPISDIRVTDDLNATFGIGLATFAMNTSSLTVGSSFTPNATFNGNTDIQLLSSGTLAVNGFETILFTVHVDLHGDNSILAFNNFAIGTGTSPNGTGTNDISTNGNIPDVNGDGIPDEDEVTPVILENSILGVAKETVSQNYLGSYQFDVGYRIYLENLGNADLSAIQVTDDLLNTFTGASIVGIESLTVSTATLNINAAFDGVSDVELLDFQQPNELLVGTTEFIDLVVRVDLTNVSQTEFNNFAIAQWENLGRNVLTEQSTNGDNPDPNNDGNPDEEELTPVTLISVINPPFNLQASSNAAGRVELTWNENADNELGFTIERSEFGSGIFTEIGNVGADVVSFADTLATPLLKYVYRVQAYNDDLVSSFSNEAEVVVNVFDRITTSLPIIRSGKAAWGDYDNDNDLDILIVNQSQTQIFTNLGNDNFSNSGITNLQNLSNGDAIWTDFDNDGDLDILMTGLSNNTPQTLLYRNLGGSFEEVNTDLIGLHLSAVASADFDKDGKNDILLTGASDLGASQAVSRIYFNLGDAEFDTDFIELEGVMDAAIGLADIDNNGFIDIVISGEATSGAFTQVYQNEDGVLTAVSSPLPNLKSSSIAFADYDNDNDFDILIAGQEQNGGALTQVFENQNATSWSLKRNFVGIYDGSATWSDFNNDGFTDILISGTRSNSTILTRIYTNNQGANFRNSEMNLPNLTQSSALWADYDQDGDQDLLFTGFNGTRNRTFLLRSIQSTFQTNEIPQAPSTLTAETEIVDGDSFTTFSWTAGTDTESSISYNIFIEGKDVPFLVSSQANVNTGFNRLPQVGNSQRTHSIPFKNLEGGNYIWGVQSIDAALRVSPFTTTNAVVFCPETQSVVLNEAVLEECPIEGTTVKVIMEGSFEVTEVNSDVRVLWGTTSTVYTTFAALATDVRLKDNEPSRIDVFTDTVEMFPATTYYYILEVTNSCGNVERSEERILTTPVIMGDNYIGESQNIERTETFQPLFDIGSVPSHSDPDNIQITWEQSRNTVSWDTIPNVNTLDLQGFAPDSTLYFRRVLVSQACSDTSNTVLVKVFQPFVHKLDSLLLVEIFNSTNGPDWTRSWDLTTRVRDWYGVTVEDGRVVELDLTNNNLTGELPNVFDIANQDNSISSALRYLSFSNNGIGGVIPPTLGELFKSLNYLDLSSNKFEGEIPAELGKLVKLETLWLSHNKLEGEVPAAIGNLALLRTFTLNNNKITWLAPELGNLDELVFFNFSTNLIVVLDDETLTMENLQELIANNLLLKEIPTAFGNCPLLRVAEFEGNRLTSIPESVQNIELLERLRIGNNRLDFGDIEPLLGKASELFTYSPQEDLGLAYDSLVEIGSKVTLKVASGGTNNLYQWLLNGVEIDGANEAEFTIFYAKQEDAGLYTCRVTNSEATDLTLRRRPIRITISCGNLVDAVAQTQDALTFCEGDNIFVQLKATQGEGFTYQWYKNNEAIFLANDSNFVATSAGNYTVKITSLEGCGEVSNQVEVLQNPAPQVNITNNGATLGFSSTATVVGQQWLLDGEAIPNANDATYQAQQGGNYSVLITDDAGCTAYSKELALGVTALDDDEAEFAENKQVTVFPNPTNGLLNIRIPNQLGKVQTLQLRDNLGRVLLTIDVKNQDENYTLNLDNIASGVYWLNILTEKESFVRKVEKL